MKEEDGKDEIPEVNDDEEEQAKLPQLSDDKPEEKTSIWTKAKKFFLQYHLPLFLIFALVFGIAYPVPGKAVGDTDLGGVCLSATNITGTLTSICIWSTFSSLSVTLIFFISGLQLKTSSLKDAFLARKALALGLSMIFFITSAFGFIVGASPKLDPPEFSLGLALFLIMPTTLSSCIVIVDYAGGFVSLALVLSITSNLVGVPLVSIYTKWLIQLFYAYDTTITTQLPEVDAASLCLSLVFTVLIPLIVGKLLLDGLRLKDYVKRFALPLKMLSAALLAFIPWMKVSQSASVFGLINGLSYFVIILCVVGFHCFFLILNFVLFRYVIPLKLEEQKCLVLVCSQKTLPVALSVLEQLPLSPASAGLATIPMILFHLFQTLFDSSVAVRWKGAKIST